LKLHKKLWNDIWVIIHHPNIHYFTYIIHHSSLHNPIHHPTFIILLTQFIIHHYIILFLSYILSSLLIIQNSSSNIHHSTYIIHHSSLHNPIFIWYPFFIINHSTFTIQVCTFCSCTIQHSIVYFRCHKVNSWCYIVLSWSVCATFNMLISIHVQ
jgi:hypothetical protein